MYSLARQILFRLTPEISHEFSLDLLGAASRLKLLPLFVRSLPSTPCKVMGLTFPNLVGLAAGLDKNGDFIDVFGQLGFGFIEVGTVTPLPQDGNPEPRLFRLPEQEALINRMGFNNKGVDHLVANLRKRKYSGILGVNIGKNKSTPLESAADDYRVCLTKVYPWADYVAVNLSSPNTPDLRKLQFGSALKDLLLTLKKEQGRLQSEHGRYVPLAVKIAPDLTNNEIKEIAATFIEVGVDGVIGTNTTSSRDMLPGIPEAEEPGGLSGAPLCYMATEKTKVLAEALQGKIPIIGVGGIMTADDAITRLNSGANLIQLYTGFIYNGPALIKHIITKYLDLQKKLGKDQVSSLINRQVLKAGTGSAGSYSARNTADSSVQDMLPAAENKKTPAQAATLSSDKPAGFKTTSRKEEQVSESSPHTEEAISSMAMNQNTVSEKKKETASTLSPVSDSGKKSAKKNNNILKEKEAAKENAGIKNDLSDSDNLSVSGDAKPSAAKVSNPAGTLENPKCQATEDSSYMPSNISLKVPSKCGVSRAKGKKTTSNTVPNGAE